MIRFMIASLLLLAFAPAAHAQTAPPRTDAAIEALVRATYTRYVASDRAEAAPLPLSPRFKATQAECAAMQKHFDARGGEGGAYGECSDDYEVLCQCNDTDGGNWKAVRVQVVHPSPSTAEALVRFAPRPGEKAGDPALKWLFVRGPKGWLLDDYWEYAQAAEGEGSYRKRLLQGIQGMRQRLKMPRWKSP